MNRRPIDPALGLDLKQRNTIERRDADSVTILIPAHNEAATVAEVVTEARRGLDLLGVSGEVLVSASACTDNTADVAATAGARVIPAGIGKGAAISAGLDALDDLGGDIVCLVDGDLRYFGPRPLVVDLVEPILRGLADVTISDLYWRPLYPQLWLHGFFAPVAGVLYPELLARVGSTPWSGQRAARRALWPSKLEHADFRVDIDLLLHWNRRTTRMRPVLADDWTNPQRPKPDLMRHELDVLIDHALVDGRITTDVAPALRRWYDAIHNRMADYNPDVDDPQEFERRILSESICELHHQLNGAGA